MKKVVISLGLLTLLLYLLTGLQSALYFLPIPAPALWVIIFCYVSFYRSFALAVVFNIVVSIIVAQFSAVPVAPLLIILNLITLFAKIIQDRFHLDDNQILLSIGLFCLAINLGLLLTENIVGGAYFPNIWAWLGQALVTAAIAPFVFYPLLRVDRQFHSEPIDHLEQLFV